MESADCKGSPGDSFSRMSLGNKRVNNSLHPYLRFWMDWVTASVEALGGNADYLSGFRTDSEQLRLWRLWFYGLRGIRAARPGCSQHNYGQGGSWAVDVKYWGRTVLHTQELRALAHWQAQKAGLRFVKGDPNHFQIFQSAEFLTAVRRFGRCRDRGAVESG